VTFVGVLFIIAGCCDIVGGIVALGVSLGGTDPAVLGDLSGPVHNLEGLGIVLTLVGILQLVTGVGIMQRRPGAHMLGITLSVIAIVTHFAYYRVLDGWAFTSMFWALVILIILCARSEEFTGEVA